MKTVLFLVGPALGHVGRSLTIARALTGTAPDTRVVFAHVTPGHGARLLSSEFECVPLSFKERGDEAFANLVETTLHSLKPDLVCFDLSPVPWLYLVRFPDIPKVYITNYFLIGLTPEPTFQTVHLRDNYLQWTQRRADRGLPALEDARSLYEADAVVLCDPPALVAAAGPVVPPVYVAGPCFWEPEGSLPDHFAELDRLLLVSLGSTGTEEGLEDIVETLRCALQCEASIWITAKKPGSQTRPRQYHLNNAPLSKILSRSALSVTQGGAGSTYASLAQGIPVAVWPAHRNHDILGQHLVRLGVGMFVADLARLEPGELREKVAGMRRRIREIGAYPDDNQGPRNAAEILKTML